MSPPDPQPTSPASSLQMTWTSKCCSRRVMEMMMLQNLMQLRRSELRTMNQMVIMIMVMR